MKKRVEELKEGDVILVDLPVWVEIMSIRDIGGSAHVGSHEIRISTVNRKLDAPDTLRIGGKVSVETRERFIP